MLLRNAAFQPEAYMASPLRNSLCDNSAQRNPENMYGCVIRLHDVLFKATDQANDKARYQLVRQLAYSSGRTSIIDDCHAKFIS
jgi:hypothetical protein